MYITAKNKMALLSIISSVLTLLLKFGAYYLTDSISLLSDALESFVNVSAGILVFIVITIASIPADEDHPYGHEKAEYFSSGVEGGLIIVAAIAIIYSAINRLISPMQLSNIIPGLLVSLLAAIVNIMTAYMLLKVAKEYDSIALESNAKHLLTDVWTTLCVLIGLVIIIITPPEWQILDPLIAVAIGINIIFVGWRLVKTSINGLMDAALPQHELNIIEQAISKKLSKENKYTSIRSHKSGAKRFIEFTVLISGKTTVFDSHKICDAIEEEIGNKLDNTIVTIHIEPL